MMCIGGSNYAQNSLCFNCFFEDQFWVGVYERETDGAYEVCKITFGAEPKDYEVHCFLNKNRDKLKFSPIIESTESDEKRINYKRMQRLVKNKVLDRGVGSKAQQALKLQYEQAKSEHKSISREKRNSDKQRKFELRQGKRLEKHRGH